MSNSRNVVVVTGGTRGLGLSIAQTILDEYKVVIIGRSCPEPVQSLIDQNSDSLFYEEYDFLDTAGIHLFSKYLIQKYGRVFGLVNNAAIGKDGVLATMHDNEISALLKVNIEAPILLTKYLIRSMLIEARGRVVNVSSVIAKTGYKGLAVYGASKAALEGFSRSLCREVGAMNITVNCIAPGYMETGMTEGLSGEKLETIKRRSPLNRLVDIQDVANSVKFLLSDDASNITGITLTVDAGSTA